MYEIAKKFSMALVVLLLIAAASAAQAPRAKIFIAPQKDSFETYLAAAFTKKHLPVAVLTEPAQSDYTLEATLIEHKTESTGAKFARCLFAYCAGIEGTESVSVRLVDNKTKEVVWSYAVNKYHQRAQSLAEAVAKHLKKEFFK